jgi:hypothetical protein
MDGKAFIKLARDTGLLGGALTATEVDLIFARVGAPGGWAGWGGVGGRATPKGRPRAGTCRQHRRVRHSAARRSLKPSAPSASQVKSKGARRISFEQFLTAASQMAEKKVSPAGPPAGTWHKSGRAAGATTTAHAPRAVTCCRLPALSRSTRASAPLTPAAEHHPGGAGAQDPGCGRPRGARHQGRQRAPARRQVRRGAGGNGTCGARCGRAERQQRQAKGLRPSPAPLAPRLPPQVHLHRRVQERRPHRGGRGVRPGGLPGPRQARRRGHARGRGPQPRGWPRRTHAAGGAGLAPRVGQRDDAAPWQPPGVGGG